MKKKHWGKSVALACSLALATPSLVFIPGNPNAYAQSSNVFTGKSFTLTISDNNFTGNVSSNTVNFNFTLTPLNGANITGVTYKGKSNSEVQDATDEGSDYAVNNYIIQKAGKDEIQITVTGSEVGSDGTAKDVTDTFKIPLNFDNNAIPGSSFTTPFKSGAKMDAFNGNLSLQFSKNTYITVSDDSSNPSLNQNVILKTVQGIKDLNNYATNGLAFMSPSYAITNDNQEAEFSSPGYITLSYGYQDALSNSGNVSGDVSLYNISIYQIDSDGNWIPIGGRVDTKKQTISAPISDFGTFVVAANEKSYSDLNDWSRPALMSLASKGVILPDGSNGRLKNNLQASINRFDFTVMLAKGQNWAPVHYNGYFTDLQSSNQQSSKQNIQLPIEGTANYKHTEQLTFNPTASINETFNIPVDNGDTANDIAIKIKNAVLSKTSITDHYNVSVSGSTVIFTALDSGAVKAIPLTIQPSLVSNVTEITSKTSPVTISTIGNGNVIDNTLNVTISDTTSPTPKFSAANFPVEVTTDDTPTSIADKIINEANKNKTVTDNVILKRNGANILLYDKADQSSESSTITMDLKNKVASTEPTGISGSYIIKSINTNVQDYSSGEDYIMSAVLNGLLQGKVDSNGSLHMDPQGHLTREEAAVFAARALKLKTGNYTTQDQQNTDKQLAKYYTDASSISNWSKPFVVAVTKAGVMQGSNKMFHPQDELTFEEAGALVYKIMIDNKMFGK